MPVIPQKSDFTSTYASLSVFYVLRKNEAESNFRLAEKKEMLKSSEFLIAPNVFKVGVKIGSFCLLPLFSFAFLGQPVKTTGLPDN